MIVNFVASEEGLELTNPFGKVYYDRFPLLETREPISVDAIRSVQAECYRLYHEIRWLVALSTETGMRLAEAAGLLRGHRP